MLRVTPIYGSRWHPDGPSSSGSCTLVEYADVKVLINAGGPVANFDFQQLPPHDCFLLTDSTLKSIGSFPQYAASQRRRYSSNDNKDGRRPPPMYATFPTVKMGQMSLYDYHANACLDGDSPPYSLNDMDRAFGQLQTIKYSQEILLPSTQQPRLSITAHHAGHVVGAAFFVLKRILDETIVVVTATYHIAKELHLDSSTLLKYATTPDVLITSPGGPAFPILSQLYTDKKLTSPLVSQAEKQVVEHILSVLRRDGNLLLPVDASGRVLELVLLLSQHWDRHRLHGAYNLVWLGPMVQNTLEFCQSQLEWMSTKLGNQFDSGGKGGQHPYSLRGVQLCTTVEELQTILQQNHNPTCVLASGLSLDHGPARDLLLKWADNDNHSILFTDSSMCLERFRLRQATTVPTSTTSVNSILLQGGGLGTAPIIPSSATTSASSAAAAAAAAVSATMASGVTTTAVTTSTHAGAVTTSSATATATATTVPTDQEEAQEETLVGLPMAPEEMSNFSTTYQLLHHWATAQVQDVEMEDCIVVDVLVPQRSPLAGPELKAFLEQEEAARKLQRQQEEERAMLREVELAKGRLRLGEEQQQSQSQTQSYETNKSSLEAAPSNASRTAMTTRIKKKSRFDSSLFLKFSKPLHCMF